MIFVGIDDTDTKESRGTNQLARLLVREIADQFRCVWIARHQLLFDARIPYTSKNGSASIVLTPSGTAGSAWLQERLKAVMRAEFIVGSDPGLCVADHPIASLSEFGQRCQKELVTQEEARWLAQQEGVFLQGLGGTEGGVIGALAAVGLAMTGNDGRVVQLAEYADDLSHWQTVESLRERGVEVVRHANRQPITDGRVDVGKKLRPNLREGRYVLFVEPAEEPAVAETDWKALKLV